MIIFYVVVEAITMVSWVFNYVYVMTNGQGGPGDATQVTELYIYQTAFQYQSPEIASAAAVTLFAATLRPHRDVLPRPAPIRDRARMSRRVVGTVSKHGLLVLATLMALFPVYVMISAAFKTQSSFLTHPWAPVSDPTLAGFRTALGDQFPRWLGNTVLLSVSSVALTLLVAALAGWGFARWSFRGRDTVLGVLVALMVVPPVVLLVPLFVFGVRIGQISTFRLVILIYVGLMLPFSVYMLTNFFRTIPASLIEAAVIDGASSWRVFRRIVLPLSAAPWSRSRSSTCSGSGTSC